MNIDFKHEGRYYRAEFVWSGVHVAHGSVGCHSKVVTGIGDISFRALYIKTPGMTELGALVNSSYSSWGTLLSSASKILDEAFAGNPEELQDRIYNIVVDSFKGIGVVIFSDHVNGGSPLKPQIPQLGVGVSGVSFSTATFARWLHKNRKRVGPIYASPVFGNPMHRGPNSHSLVQVFTWIPKANAWTIASDMGDIPCPRDPEHTKETMMQDEQLVNLFPGVSKEVLTRQMIVTYL